MRLANIDGVRSDPARGARGLCPACGADVIAKCGTQKLWHWAHASIRHCDTWWEPETDWHRGWKSLFPLETQEIIHTDPTTGERHIADVKTARGMVIEFQNSPMRNEELRSREEFYGHMVWIVNATHFLGNFTLGSRLPDPDAAFLRDIIIHPNERRAWYGCYSRKSEATPGSSMIQIHSTREIQADIDRYFVGHHLYSWKRKRQVWLSATKPVFLDFGDENLWWLQTFDDRGLPCVKRVKKDHLISKNGGSLPATPWREPILVDPETTWG